MAALFVPHLGSRGPGTLSGFELGSHGPPGVRRLSETFRSHHYVPQLVRVQPPVTRLIFSARHIATLPLCVVSYGYPLFNVSQGDRRKPCLVETFKK